MNITLARKSPLMGRVAKVLADSDHSLRVSFWDEGPTDVLVTAPGEPAGEPATNLARFVISPGPGVTGFVNCNSIGLAKALAMTIGSGPATLGVTRPGANRGTTRVEFPPPIGVRYGSKSEEGAIIVPPGSEIGGLVVTTPDRTVSVIDDAGFLEAACLAAGVLTALNADDFESNRQPADCATTYIDACQRVGLVVAELSAR